MGMFSFECHCGETFETEELLAAHLEEKGLSEIDNGGGMSVLQTWVETLPLRMQATLILGLRGPDTHRCPEIKTITRWLRGLTFRPGNPNNVAEFMRVMLPERILEKGPTARELEFVSQHYYSHLMHALEVVAYKYPDGVAAFHSFNLYYDMCRLFHLTVESRQDFENRLRQCDWPEGIQPETGAEAIELLRKHEHTVDEDYK